jgi:hypothetical protein
MFFDENCPKRGSFPLWLAGWCPRTLTSEDLQGGKSFASTDQKNRDADRGHRRSRRASAQGDRAPARPYRAPTEPYGALAGQSRVWKRWNSPLPNPRGALPRPVYARARPYRASAEPYRAPAGLSKGIEAMEFSTAKSVQGSCPSGMCACAALQRTCASEEAHLRDGIVDYLRGGGRALARGNWALARARRAVAQCGRALAQELPS